MKKNPVHIYGRFPRWTLTIAVILAILWLTLARPPRPPEEFQLWEHADKVVHALMFATLFIVVSVDMYRYGRVRVRFRDVRFFSAFAWCALLGAVIELFQPYVGRTCDPIDFLADVAGILMAWPLAWLITNKLCSFVKNNP